MGAEKLLYGVVTPPLLSIPKTSCAGWECLPTHSLMLLRQQGLSKEIKYPEWASSVIKDLYLTSNEHGVNQANKHWG